MYHPNNLRRGPRPPLLRTPLRMGYEVNLVLSRANNEVHTFKRQLEDQKLAYNRLVSELSDQKTQNQQLLEDNHQLDFKVTEMEDELAHYEAVNTGLYKRTDLNETKISNLEHKISVLSSRNVVLEDERQRHQLSKVLEADNIRLTSERDSLAALIKFQEQTHRTEVAASESTKLALVSKVKEMEDELADHKAVVNTWLHKSTDQTTEISNLESKISVLSSRNVVLEDELQRQQVSEALEADNIRLTSERDSLAAFIKTQEQTHRAAVAASESTHLALVSKVKEMEDEHAAFIKTQEQTHRATVDASESTQLALVSKVKEMEDLIAITEHEFEQERIVLEDICLEFKRKKLGFFGRRMQDRQTEIAKLKHKMQVKVKKHNILHPTSSSPDSPLPPFPPAPPQDLAND